MHTPLERWKLLRSHIDALAIQHHRHPDHVRLLVVSKGQPVLSIVELAQAGQVDFGESYYQEAIIKIRALAEYPLVWHFIGPIQSNKVKGIVEHFDWVHSVDRWSIAEKLEAACIEREKMLNVLVQVNISQESQKSGLRSSEVLAFVEKLKTCPHLIFQGLMGISADTRDEAYVTRTFLELRAMQQQLETKGIGCVHLSMGMSQDYPLAICASATWLRIGSLIFSEEQKDGS